jgi:phage gp36-like protein
VPGYVTELEGSLLVRQATNNLAFLFRGHAKRVATVGDNRIVAVLQDALRDVHSFSRTRALPALRTSDKRIFLESRATLYRLAKVAPPATREIRQAVENLARFLESMSVVSRRENLRLHDRALLARAGRHLEAAQFNLGMPEVARRELADAVKAASALYGRDAQLDAYLRGQRHFPADWLHEQELALEMARLGEVLAGVAAP